MKKFLLTMMIALGAVSLGVAEAEAKRVGGGGAIGRQSQNVSRQAPPAQASPNAAKSAPAAAPGATPPKPASPWKGILGGALLGLGLGALFSSMGMGGAMASMLSSILMIGLLAAAGMFIYRMIKNRSAGTNAPKPAFANAYAGGQANGTPEIGSRVDSQPSAFQSAAAASAFNGAGNGASWEVPADFDVNAFLRNSKTYYIRLQAAWDRADVNDIREFTTPEMFGELRLQLQERGASANHTDVVSLDAELLGVETTDKDYLASVKFSGIIKEAEHAPAEAFAEVWNMTKPVNGQGGWVLAGIQPV
ncbi:Tim44-like domain-containing protein [Undibacterium sp.]|jgi:predicted lipid-binding transport protein (Tim44 family)|uniref:Tim44 domain-containing protein n=1 Tax=Undibacterium sp. TaxID=1914977 RepID=UPI002C5BF063|nr:Tim44-like domain-containing protein [Undibacterium sp.]HTD05145.1 Tim44-like domain-containing protein [Undibacterium sp.]